jgi:hypothetical protein
MARPRGSVAASEPTDWRPPSNRNSRGGWVARCLERPTRHKGEVKAVRRGLPAAVFLRQIARRPIVKKTRPTQRHSFPRAPPGDPKKGGVGVKRNAWDPQRGRRIFF